MGRYLFDLKREQAHKALEVLFEEKSVAPELILGELLSLQSELEVYVQAVRDEIGDKQPESAAIG